MYIGMRKERKSKIDELGERREGNYGKEVEHNINAWCSIWENKNQSKNYRDAWNEIYAYLSKNESK